MKRTAAGVLLGFVVVVATAPSALAAPGTVSLSASAAVIDYGRSVHLSGQVSTATAGETVDIDDASNTPLTPALTDTNGRFSVSLTPSANVTVHADWQGNVSPNVTIGVRAVVTVNLTRVRLFGTAIARGTVAPANPGAPVDVTLLRNGNVVRHRRPAMGAGGRFRVAMPIMRPGRYRVRASFADAGHRRGTAFAGPRSTPLPSLTIGSTGIFVLLLERRLVQLRYRLVDIDRTYDVRTGDAVLAFRKVQRTLPISSVNASVWRALAAPIRPRPRFAWPRFHIEVDQTRQVLYTVFRGSVTHIMHISSGKPSTPTPDGSFQVFSKLPGFSSHGLYYPSFFDGNRAIHGWTEVPPYAASHGCVRVPYWNAKWIFGLADYGTRVLVYH
jgi:L,D-transpeptidase catalytic domain